jgi:chromosome segregation ATPase
MSIYLRHAERVAQVGPSDALTLAAAAEQLEVTPQRVSQMLASGQLEGPLVEGRAAPNTGRVWRWSADAARDRPRRRRLSAERDDSKLGELKQRVADLEAQLRARLEGAAHSDAVRTAKNSERAAKAAALHLKVAADAAAAEVNDLQSQNKKLRAEVDLLTTALRRAEDENDELRARAGLDAKLRQSYSDALAQLLTPDDPGDL